MHKKKLYWELTLLLLFLITTFLYLKPNETQYSNYNLNASDYDDIFGDIYVEKPSYLDIVLVGQNYTIIWTYTGSIELVTIALYKNYQFVDIIAITTNNDGNYLWTVDAYEESNDYIIAIWDYNDFNNQDFSAFFTIALTYPSDSLMNIVFIILLILIGVVIVYISFIIINKLKQHKIPR